MKENSCKLLGDRRRAGAVYTCASAPGQLGIDTVIVEAKKPGGTCLNVGCIPVQGADPCRRRVRERHAHGAAAKPARHLVRNAPSSTSPRPSPGKTASSGGLNNGVAGLLKKARVKTVMAGRHFATARPSRSQTETRRAGDPRRTGRDRNRLEAGRHCRSCRSASA